MKFVQKMYSLFVWYIFKTVAIKNKKSHYGFKAYPCPNILIPWLNGQYMLPYYSKKSFFFLNLMPKRGAKLFPPSLNF